MHRWALGIAGGSVASVGVALRSCTTVGIHPGALAEWACGGVNQVQRVAGSAQMFVIPCAAQGQGPPQERIVAIDLTFPNRFQEVAQLLGPSGSGNRSHGAAVW